MTRGAGKNDPPFIPDPFGPLTPQKNSEEPPWVPDPAPDEPAPEPNPEPEEPND
jgi:hypothetical protein